MFILFAVLQTSPLLLRYISSTHARLSHYFRVSSTKHSLLKTMADEELHFGDSGASTTYPVQCSSLEMDGFVMIKDRPCKIVEMNTSKSGKHGHAKVHLVGLDLFTGETHEDIFPSTHNLDVPNVCRRDLQVFGVKDGYLTIKDDNFDSREGPKVPEGELGEEITARAKWETPFMVTVLEAMGEKQVISLRSSW
ncbi:eukaryotic translation initiation factor 5A-1-like [Platichthys flesus]|uniref:eukaryotic translation initiation factor 5A-1-like n=1 Tax=Platichthys flesus TaxID=8260 RepID=UPI002DB6C3D8|nr:eukaryotic translation initiation factor 5A-1-like [Platichthys flesus]